MVTEKGFIQINSVPQLRLMARNRQIDCFIHFGAMRSSKMVTFDLESDEFYIHHEIDDTDEEVSAVNLMNPSESNIGKAIATGTFYAFPSDDFQNPKGEEDDEYRDVAVIDLSTTTLDLYCFPDAWSSEDTEMYLSEVLGYKLSECSWGTVSSGFNDYR